MSKIAYNFRAPHSATFERELARKLARIYTCNRSRIVCRLARRLAAGSLSDRARVFRAPSKQGSRNRALASVECWLSPRRCWCPHRCMSPGPPGIQLPPKGAGGRSVEEPDDRHEHCHSGETGAGGDEHAPVAVLAWRARVVAQWQAAQGSWIVVDVVHRPVFCPIRRRLGAAVLDAPTWRLAPGDPLSGSPAANSGSRDSGPLSPASAGAALH